LPARSKIGGALDSVAIILALALLSTPLLAQTAYKYKDANGQWVFTDRATSAAGADHSFALEHQNDTLRITVDRKDSGDSTQLIAVNDCLCAATFQAKILHSDDPAIPDGTEYKATLTPRTQQTLIHIQHAGGPKTEFRYVWRFALGPPEATHNPPGPYRAPFAIGSTHLISQAYPSRFTHTTPDSEYAIDIALPDGTQVYAAREGVVINVRHDAFRGALARAMLDQANVIEILHDDGTIAIYAHLHWDSIRVHIGERVARGQYIANSGNTGFTSGPHLHFAVLRNAGVTDVSVPIQFASNAGVAVTPATQMQLTAY
jgi:murein DD-endopeptidase MepM/ murein hydrolase activator NlpD